MSTAVMERKPTNKIVTVDSKLSNTDLFAKWLYKETCSADGLPNGKIVTIMQCARMIASLNNDQKDVTDVIVRSRISAARKYFEENLNCTIWPVYGRGWRSSSKVETAIFCLKAVRKTIAWAERTRRLRVITEKKHIPFAMQQVFGKAEGGINSLSKTRQRFLEGWMKYQETEEKKELEAPKNA